MKPNAPVEIRGPFKPIKTNVPGIEISENFPRMAKHADKFSIVRSMYHTAAAVHDTGHQMMQTGRLFQGGIEHPHFGCVLSNLKGPKGDVPAHVLLPRTIGNTGGNMPHGQNAGYPGQELTTRSSSTPIRPIPTSRSPTCCRPTTSPPCASIAARTGEPIVDKTVSMFETSQDARLLDSHLPSGLHADVLAEGARSFRPASRSPRSVREKYGMNRFGQSCLLARRMIEAGVRFVTVNMFETVFDEITWDIHGSTPFSPISCYTRPGRPDVRQRLRLAHRRPDRARPAIKTRWSWPWANSAARRRSTLPAAAITGRNAGASHGRRPLKGGQIVGASDEIGGAPKDRPTNPGEVAATIFKGLGIDMKTELPGFGGRPIPLVDRGIEPIAELFT